MIIRVSRWSAGACLVACLLALTGCASAGGGIPVSVTQRGTVSNYAPTRYVSVLYQKPSRPFRVLAVLKAEGHAGVSSEQVVGALSQKAQALGANAIVLSNRSAEQGPKMQFNPSGGNYQFSSGSQVPRFEALAIRWVKGKH